MFNRSPCIHQQGGKTALQFTTIPSCVRQSSPSIKHPCQFNNHKYQISRKIQESHILRQNLFKDSAQEPDTLISLDRPQAILEYFMIFIHLSHLFVYLYRVLTSTVNGYLRRFRFYTLIEISRHSRHATKEIK